MPLLSKVLSDLDIEVTRQEGVEPVLRCLDESKHQLSGCFGEQLRLEIAGKLLALKVQNLCLSKYHFLARDVSLLSKPYGLILDPVNSCNLACPGCVHSSNSQELHWFDWQGGMLSEDRFDAFLRQYGPFALQMALYNYGEPLINPNTPKFIRKAKSYLMRTTLSTNLAVKRFDAGAYARSGLDFMTLSIDGATQGVYEKFRKKGNLEVVFQNIQSLVEARRKEGRNSPVLNWQFLAFEHNAHEIEQALELARSLGVDQFTVAPPFDVSWDDPKIRPAAVPAKTHVFHADWNRRMVENWNPFPGDIDVQEVERLFESRWIDRLTPEHRKAVAGPKPFQHTCHYLYKNMVMDANSRVFPCCAAPRPDADLLFAIFDAGTKEAFNAEKYQLARMSFADKAAYRAARSATLDTEPYCVKCEWYGAQITAHIDRAEMRKYMEASAVFDSRSAGILLSW